MGDVTLQFLEINPLTGFGGGFGRDFGLTGTGIPQTPLPTTLPLFATGIGGLGLLGWRRKRKAQATA